MQKDRHKSIDDYGKEEYLSAAFATANWLVLRACDLSILGLQPTSQLNSAIQRTDGRQT
jgi:hypothetical protein